MNKQYLIIIYLAQNRNMSQNFLNIKYTIKLKKEVNFEKTFLILKIFYQEIKIII